MEGIPDTRYARAPDGTHLAYQVVGTGPVDLVYFQPYFSHIEYIWEEPRYERFLRRLASFSRLILWDRRGCGLSDATTGHPDMETRMDDARVVMDEVGSARAVLYGASESGALACLFAATHPDRTIGLVLIGTTPRMAWAPDFPWGETREEHEHAVGLIRDAWGTDGFVREAWPGVADDQVVHWISGLCRNAMSPRAAAEYEEMIYGDDVRDILPAIQVPTMILHRQLDSPEANRYLAEHVRGAEYVALPGGEHLPFIGDQDSVTSQIQRFVDSAQEEEALINRQLATVLFTDIVSSTEAAATLGDRGWSEVVERHHAAVRGLLSRYQGSEVDTAGDGFFATFDGPARAARCAQTIVEAVKPLGIQVRAGLHTGEVETIAGKTGGMAVVIGARVGSLAQPSEVLASRTVRDLTAGSGLRFEDAGEHQLKGVPESWHLYRVLPRTTSA